jgi:hypothetical protein
MLWHLGPALLGVYLEDDPFPFSFPWTYTSNSWSKSLRGTATLVTSGKQRGPRLFLFWFPINPPW